MAKKKSAKKNAAGGKKIIPLGDRVVISRYEASEITEGGIVLPDSARDKPQKGTVISIGDGHTKSDGTKLPLTVQPGDNVLFSAYGPEEIKLGDEEFLLLRESDILATF